MAQIKDIVRTNLEAPKPGAPLEDKVEFIHHILRLRAIGLPIAHRNGHPGYEVKVALKPLVREQFGLDSNQADHLNELIRQVLRRTGAAVCVRNVTGEVPVWFVSQELPKDYVVVSRFVATGGHRLNGTLTPTRREMKLTPEEVGENREPAPVTVTKVEKCEETVMAPGTEKRLPEGAVSRHEWKEYILSVYKELGAEILSGYEIAEYLEPLTTKNIQHIRRMVRDMAVEGSLYARAESKVEQQERFPGVPGYRKGKPCTLYALTPEALGLYHVSKHVGVYTVDANAPFPKHTPPTPPTPSVEPTIEVASVLGAPDASALLQSIIAAEVAKQVGELQQKYDRLLEEKNELQKRLAKINRAMKG